MVIYHFAWDLWAFGLIATDVGQGFYWRLFAHSIASTFLLIVGISLVLATRRGIRWDSFLLRLAMVAGGALLVSLGTWFSDPNTFVFFGILHLIAVASVLALPFVGLPLWLAAGVASAVITIGNGFASPLFSQPWLVWLGLGTEVPPTVDFYPVFPWFGAVLAGIVAGRLFMGSALEARVARWLPNDALTRVLATAGRWSLVIYLAHQVILFGGVSLAASMLGPRATAPPAPPAQSDAGTSFMNECVPACGSQGRDVATCTTYCACMFAGLTGTDILATPAERLSDDQRQRLSDRSRLCAGAVARPLLPGN
jgi:uncharacterized membrane protein